VENSEQLFLKNAVLVTVTQNKNKINQEHFKGKFKAAEKMATYIARK